MQQTVESSDASIFWEYEKLAFGLCR